MLLTTGTPTVHAAVSPETPWGQARGLAHRAPLPLAARTMPLAAAAGLTLAEDLRAQHPLPAFDTAAMDGYAVAGPGPWRIRGAVRAGGVWDGLLAPGEGVEISTGAPVPAGACAVLPLELAACGAGWVSGATPAPGKHVRRAGEDASAGTCLAPAGTRVGPALLGLAASCGHDALLVRPRPRVRVLITGDELDLVGTPGPGRVRDALGPLLPPLVTALGGEVAGVRHVPDKPAGLLARAVREARDAEVIVVTGSTSVGATDQLRRLLREAGARMVVDTVACRPGHPQLLAGLDAGRWVVGLPGNPYAALVAAHTLLAPLIAGLSGRGLPALPEVPVRGDVRPAPGLTRLVPVAWEGSGARIVGGHRAAFLHGAALGDALAVITEDWKDGDRAPLVLLAG
ncbi:molybdopterin molybdotransferase MoeA [Streptomyces sp. Isolate_45]|uniref:molybdopterin molybdotransferase MoeA n=1 Tax=Streptomyces sp. Isolate_45 TaxID=2950111 RepID=UPI002481B5EE|nr:molybdopterin molybdotransferase MoeA [Streptomyces sp. Isolate_45]MDA5280884.1 molybdopterin molybdotransferase MoeA [Streptomyces sp. Isolate_45]